MATATPTSSTEDVGESMVVCGKREGAMPLSHPNTKKTTHRGGCKSEEEEEKGGIDSEEDPEGTWRGVANLGRALP